jgi:hypothetical protein
MAVIAGPYHLHMGLADLTRQYFPASGNVFPLFFRRRKAAKKNNV